VTVCESYAVRYGHFLWCLPCKMRKDTFEMLAYSVFCLKVLAILKYADRYSAQTPDLCLRTLLSFFCCYYHCYSQAELRAENKRRIF
jgi:hypothetical protein